MSSACQDFRREWLEDETRAGGPSAGAEGHLASCSDCAGWLRRTRRQVGMLRSLERLIAPRALDERLAAVESAQELSPSQARAVAEVRGLTRLSAPPELDERLRAGDWAVEGPVLRLVRSLARLTAPAVLERLVEEELVDPRKAQADRYVGTLGRLRAPRSLEQRVVGVLRGGLSWNRSRVFLAAAALLTLIAWPLLRRTSEPTQAVHEYELVHATSEAELSPLARALGGGLAPLEAAVEPLGEAAAAPLAPGRQAPEEPVDDGRRSVAGAEGVAPAGGAPAGGAAAAAAGGSGSQPVSPLALVLADPFATVAHEGRRRVTFFEHGGGVPKYVAYVERVVTDGRGNYAIEPLQALTPVLPDEATFLLLMQAREGFIRRYRDFQVRDAALFRRNYAVEVSGALVVAGRDCRALVVSNRLDGGRFELAVDAATGIVLRAEEFDDAGLSLASVEYTDYQEQPDLSNVLFHQQRNQETSYDPKQRLGPQLGFKPRRPKTLPPGYELVEVATVADPDSGREWLKLTFGDGVRSLFFLQPMPSLLSIPSGLARSGEGDKIVLMRWGPVRVAQARIERYEFIAVGRATEEELVDLIESALP